LSGPSPVDMVQDFGNQVCDQFSTQEKSDVLDVLRLLCFRQWP
jgi:hypothetical protein